MVMVVVVRFDSFARSFVRFKPYQHTIFKFLLKYPANVKCCMHLVLFQIIDSQIIQSILGCKLMNKYDIRNTTYDIRHTTYGIRNTKYEIRHTTSNNEMNQSPRSLVMGIDIDIDIDIVV